MRVHVRVQNGVYHVLHSIRCHVLSDPTLGSRYGGLEMDTSGSGVYMLVSEMVFTVCYKLVV